MHSEIRGIPDAYEKVLKTIEELKKFGINDIRVGYTGSDKNIRHLARVYNFAKANNIEFTMSIVHNSENYFNIDTNTLNDLDSLENQLNYVIKEELKQVNPRRLFRTYYFKGIINYAKTGKRLLPCCALKNSFFINAVGDIFPCNILETSIGNLKEDNFKNIWTSGKHDKLRSYCQICNKCWMVCTVKNSMRKAPFKVAKSIVAEKVRLWTQPSGYKLHQQELK
jgi:MoaA/NifB/PqqE/SkfB family radical SAM enzyme